MSEFSSDNVWELSHFTDVADVVCCLFGQMEKGVNYTPEDFLAKIAKTRYSKITRGQLGAGIQKMYGHSNLAVCQENDKITHFYLL